jgi:hypothetical protein
MALIFRLPIMLLELLLRRLFRRGDDITASVVTPEAARAAATPAPTPAPTRPPAPRAVADPPPASGGGAFTGASANGAPPPTAEEAIERRREREAAETATPNPEQPTPLRPVTGDAGHVDREAEIVESFGPADDVGDVGGTITVDEPWDGYAGMPASAIVARLRSADGATKGVVALYERSHKNRATVLRAAR